MFSAKLSIIIDIAFPFKPRLGRMVSCYLTIFGALLGLWNPKLCWLDALHCSKNIYIRAPKSHNVMHLMRNPTYLMQNKEWALRRQLHIEHLLLIKDTPIHRLLPVNNCTYFDWGEYRPVRVSVSLAPAGKSYK